MKNFHYKGKVFFWSGLIMLILAGVIWVVSGGAKAVLADIQSGRAGNDANGACSAPGCYSEDWTATEVIGMYRIGHDGGQLEDNGWTTSAGARVCGNGSFPGWSTEVGNGLRFSGNGYCSYKTSVGTDNSPLTFQDAYVDSRYPMSVTKWQINGHVH